jgi:CelD/BcsL family acetyltransferase involved in cellulose biosynthesis
LTLIGSGLSDYLEPPIDSRRANEVIRSLQAHLQSRSDWDKCNWQDLSCDTPLKHLASQVLDDIECREIPLLGTFDAYWKARSQNLRRNIHRDAKKLETLGNIQFCVSRDNSPCLINALLDLHTARWQTHGQPGMIEVNSCAAFITDAAREFARQGMLRIFLLQLQQKPVAVILSAAYRGILFNYLTGFNPEYEAAGLGRKLLFESIRYAFENGFTSWNFLRGDEPYKAWWGAISIPKCRVIVTRKA